MVVVVLVVCPWCWCGCGELMAEGQRGTTLQCMAVCVCGLNMGGVWLDGGRFVTTTNANTTQLMGFVAMTAPHSPAVSHQHTDVCRVWQSLLWRVCLVVSIWQVCLAVHNSHMVCLVAVGRMHHNRCCLLLLLVLLCGQGILGVLHHTCVCVC